MRVAPIFVFDSGETFFPVGVEESLAATHPKLVGRNGPIAGPVDVSKLNDDCIRLDFPADMKQPELPPVGYWRVAEGGGLYWHQYWLWYVYNPWNVGGVGRHEGDWEFVQLGCTDQDGAKPVLVTYSQHHTGAKREYWAVSHERGRPLVYAARGSHANYLAPVATVDDRCDAKGRRIDEIEWREFGPWATWTGRWGNSTGEGRSPESPGQQHSRWATPHLFHAAAR
jgi:hypothetical protein